MTVVSFEDAKLKRDPHWSGEAVCLACRHEWVATAPTGTLNVECPACELKRGVPKFNFGTIEGQMGYSCNCQSQMFFFKLHDTGRVQILCVGCGGEQVYEGVFPS